MPNDGAMRSNGFNSHRGNKYKIGFTSIVTNIIHVCLISN